MIYRFYFSLDGVLSVSDEKLYDWFIFFLFEIYNIS